MPGIMNLVASLGPVGAGVCDPYWALVDLLMEFEGTDGSTTFIDSSQDAHSISVGAGTIQIDTAQFKYGTSSGLFNADGGLQINNSGSPPKEMNLLNNDFTIEMFVRFNSVTPQQCFINQYSFAVGFRSFYFRLGTGPNLQFGYTSNGTTETQISKSWSPATNTWYHVAITREGANIRMFVDGIQVGTTDTGIGSTIIYDSTTEWVVGSFFSGSTQAFDGWMDGLRVTIGVARYTGTFTPPQSLYPLTACSGLAIWNPKTQGGNIVISGDALVATRGPAANAFYSLRANVGKSTGKWYWEILVGTDPTIGGHIMLGIGLITQNQTGFPGDASGGYGSQARTGSTALFYPGPVVSGLNYTAGDVVGFALDMTVPEIKIYVNNVLSVTQGVAATTWYPCVGLFSSGMQVTLQQVLTYAPPSGFLQLSA